MWLAEGCEVVLWGRMPMSFTQELAVAEQADDRVRSGDGAPRSVQPAAQQECAELLRAAREKGYPLWGH